MASIKMSDLTFGSLNNIQDGNSGESGDRRRTNTTTAMRMAAEATFSKDTLNNVSEFNGVVVSHRLVGFASYQNKTALFNDYLYKANQDEEEAEVKGIDFSSFAYKVYIPEIEPRPAPNSNTDPVLVTYPDVYSDIADGNVPLALGSLVAVKFEDVENLFNPRIVRVVGGPIAIENISSVELNNIFNANIPGFVGGTDPPGGEGRPGTGGGPGPLTGKNTSCPSYDKTTSSGKTKRIRGSETQTGKKLGDGSDWTGFPDNPVSGWCLPMKPGDAGDKPSLVPGFNVSCSSTYFRDQGNYHGALDFRGKDGRPLYAVDDGVVVTYRPICWRNNGRPSGRGNEIRIKTDSGYYVQYIHMDTPAIPKMNERVKKGQLIGYNGNTGNSNGPHLHFAVNTENEFGYSGRSARGAAAQQLHPADFYPEDWLIYGGKDRVKRNGSTVRVLYKSGKATVLQRDREDSERNKFWTKKISKDKTDRGVKPWLPKENKAQV